MSPELAEYLSRRASRAFRGLARYDGDDVEVVHTRDDLSESEVRDRTETIHGAVRPRRDTGALDELGPVYASVQMREEAVILHFPLDEDLGYIVGLEPDVARDLSAFVSDCVRIIEQEHGPFVE